MSYALLSGMVMSGAVLRCEVVNGAVVSGMEVSGAVVRCEVVSGAVVCGSVR